MPMRERFQAAYRGLRAERGLPSKTSGLWMDIRKYNTLPRLMAFIALAEIPDTIIRLAEITLQGQYDHSPNRPMRPASQLRWHTKRERDKREAERVAIEREQHRRMGYPCCSG